MKRTAVSDTALSGVNIVPVIGVTLVLLVILIVMSPIMNLPNLDVDLPEAVTKETKEQNITVSLGTDGRLSIDTEIVEFPEFPSRLRQYLRNFAQEDTVIILRADKSLPYGTVEKLIRVVNRIARGRGVALATKQRVSQLEPAS